MLAGLETVALPLEQTIKAYKVIKPPIIDGKLNEFIWTKAKPVTKFYIHNTKKIASQTTIAKVLFDDNALYVGFHCRLPANKKPFVTKRKNIWLSDCVEVMLDPGKSASEYFHFLVDCQGKVYDEHRSQGGYIANSKWSGEIKTAVSSNLGYWECEIMIPYYTLNISSANKLWGINLCRGARKPHEDSSIAENGAFNFAGKFLKLTGLNVDFSKYAWHMSQPVITTSMKGEKITVLINTVINNGGNKRKMLVDFALLGLHDAVVSNERYDFAAHTETGVKSTMLELSTPGKYQCLIGIIDPKNKKIMTRKKYELNVNFCPVEIVLCDPHYRNAIFVTQKLDKVRAQIKSNLSKAKLKNAKIQVRIINESGKILKEKVLNSVGNVDFDAQSLPEGRMTINVKVLDALGKKIGEAKKTFKKLPYLKNEVWRGKDGNWHVDGKPFFILSEWNNADQHVAKTNVSMVRFRKTKRPAGVKIMSKIFSHAPFAGAMYTKGKTHLTDADCKLIRETTKKLMHNKELFAYFLVDEPLGRIKTSLLLKTAEIIRDTDPYHPIVMSTNSVEELCEFSSAAEINGFHSYPHYDQNKSKADMSRVVTCMDQVMSFYKTNDNIQTVTYMSPGFNYADYGDINARAPSREEIRSEYMIAQILGARGIMLYCVPDINYYPDIKIGIPALVNELSFYKSILLQPPIKKIKANTAKVRFIARKYQGHWWIFVCSTTHDKLNVMLTVPDLGTKTLQVVGEKRQINIVNGKLNDVFNSYQVHVYTTNLSKLPIRPFAELDAKIANEIAKRRTPGNLIHQDNENNTVKVTASSNNKIFRRSTDILWHVADGVKIENDYGRGNRFAWFSKPRAFPAWLEINFLKPLTFSRIVVYATNKSLKNYTIQAYINGKWQMISLRKGNKSFKEEHTFKCITSTKIRLHITATNGSQAIVSEVEVFNK